MEVGRNLLSLHTTFPPKTHFRNSPPQSVTMLHEVAARAVMSLPTTSLTRQFPASIILREQRDESRSLLHSREDKLSQHWIGESWMVVIHHLFKRRKTVDLTNTAKTLIAIWRGDQRNVKCQSIIHDPKFKKTSKQRKINENFDPNDPLRLFLSSSVTHKFLNEKEETELFIHVQELNRLEDMKQRLQSEFGREPTFVEWAEAVGMNSGTLQKHILSGNSSREKMIYSNFRMVVHMAKKYQGMGLNLQDLLQEGVYDDMRKVSKAKELYIQEGHQPTNEELAKRISITVQRMEMLLVSTRKPLSMQNQVWADEPTTLQEITADPKIENPSLSIAKQHMRQHVRNLLSTLPPRESRLIRLRYGIGGGSGKVLSEIGVEFGLTKERVRQLEVQALDKLKKCTSSHGLDAYADLLKY